LIREGGDGVGGRGHAQDEFVGCGLVAQFEVEDVVQRPMELRGQRGDVEVAPGEGIQEVDVGPTRGQFAAHELVESACLAALLGGVGGEPGLHGGPGSMPPAGSSSAYAGHKGEGVGAAVASRTVSRMSADGLSSWCRARVLVRMGVGVRRAGVDPVVFAARR
jgi:hypothetical protein